MGIIVRVKSKSRWWWFHKLFRTRKYRAYKIMEKVMDSHSGEIMEKTKRCIMENLLYGIPYEQTMDSFYKKEAAEKDEVRHRKAARPSD